MASAAYRAGEKLHSEYYGEDSDYTNKGGVICTEILLPPHAPREYADRETLWNAVEKVEKGKKSQLAYSFDISFQNEFTQEENIALARQFLTEHFVSRGIVVDFAVHEPEKEEGGINNPHFHFMCPIRPIEQNGKWGLKQKREYVLDENGNRIPDGKHDQKLLDKEYTALEKAHAETYAKFKAIREEHQKIYHIHSCAEKGCHAEQTNQKKDHRKQEER